MSSLLPRTWWTSTNPGGSPMTASQVRGFALHYPARGEAFGVITEDRLRAEIQGWRRYHMETQGWSDIAYQACIDQSGRIVELRGIGRRSAANGGTTVNMTHGAVILALANTERPSDEMVAAVRWFRQSVWLGRYARAAEVTGHRRIRPGGGTECPGNVVLGLIDDGTFTDADDGAEIAPVPPPPPLEEEDDVKPYKIIADVGRGGPAYAWTPTSIGALNGEYFAFLVRSDLADNKIHFLPTRDFDLHKDMAGRALRQVAATVEGTLADDFAALAGDEPPADDLARVAGAEVVIADDEAPLNALA